MIKKGILSLTTVLVLSTSVNAKESFTIQNMSMQDALNKISKQSQLPYVVNNDLIKNLKAPNLHSIEGLQTTLNKLLKNTNLEANIENNTIIIRKKSLSNKETNSYGKVDVISSQNEMTENSGSYIMNSMNTATKMNLSNMETPQTISVTTREKMNDFSLDTINDVLEYTPGVNVERIETDRTYYTSRGFDITNFQVDGMSLPLTTHYGDIDTSMYDHVEITKGATGLMSGPGDPSATVNMIRKRPTKNLQSSVEVEVGSWNKFRTVGDVSGSISDDVRARVVAMYENKDSYLDRNSTEKNLFYGVLEKDITDDTLFTIGYSRYKNNANSPLWGALPLYYNNGEMTNYNSSTSTSSNWSFWDTQTDSAFAELKQNFNNDWILKAAYNYKKVKGDSDLFYMYGVPSSTDESGLTGYGSEFTTDISEQVADVYVQGPYKLGKYEHQAVLGINWAKKHTKENSLYDYTTGNGFPAIPNLNIWDGNTPYPTFVDRQNGSNYTDKQLAFYAATNIHINEKISMVLGSRISNWETSGTSYKKSRATKNSGILTPYAGLIYNFSDSNMIYTSYTTTYSPTNYIDTTGSTLKPTEAVNYEVGTKNSFFEDSLITSLSLFKIVQDNSPEKEGTLADGRDYYSSKDGITSKGFEFDINGSINNYWQMAFGYTYLKIEDKDGNKTKTYIPKQLINLSTTYTIPSYEKLKVGASLKWQDDIYREQSKAATTGPLTGKKGTTTQKAYSILNLMAQYKINKNFSAVLNINNVTDEKYINSLYWDQGYYGAPRSAYLTFKWTY